MIAIRPGGEPDLPVLPAQGFTPAVEVAVKNTTAQIFAQRL
jgi:hypothetical protein